MSRLPNYTIYDYKITFQQYFSYLKQAHQIHEVVQNIILKYLILTYYVPGLLCTFFLLIIILLGKYYYSHFPDVEIEAERLIQPKW